MFSNIPANIPVHIFKVSFGGEGVIGRNTGAGCSPIVNDQEVSEKR
jgi:hypothetical protein